MVVCVCARAFSWAPRGHPGRFLPNEGIHITFKSSQCDLTCRCRETEEHGNNGGQREFCKGHYPRKGLKCLKAESKITYFITIPGPHLRV